MDALSCCCKELQSRPAAVRRVSMLWHVLQSVGMFGWPALPQFMPSHCVPGPCSQSATDATKGFS